MTPGTGVGTPGEGLNCGASACLRPVNAPETQTATSNGRAPEEKLFIASPSFPGFYNPDENATGVMAGNRRAGVNLRPSQGSKR